ncbi:hypothetical protein DRN74_01895 [Candidatus Micrarchaeota archaeon]|nr:MAG: hypothetical protein DRN74_01895 [Candidatus Micrarchaeota archaeon]
MVKKEEFWICDTCGRVIHRCDYCGKLMTGKALFTDRITMEVDGQGVEHTYHFCSDECSDMFVDAVKEEAGVI